jgi:[ribosomal protein S5]-alanine N-acetyltransferase
MKLDARVLRAARLLLTPMSGEDAGLYCSLYGDARVMRQVGRVLAPARAAHAFALALAQARIQPPRAYYWTVRTYGDEDACGLVALVRDPADADSAELGVLLHPDAQGRGHASEAITCVAAHAFAELAMQRLWTRHRRCHHAAHGLMHRLGFVPIPDGAAVPPVLRRWALCAAAFAGGTSAR